ncbi:hypothetical protein [Acinetobacter sp. ANC 3781]|uniref:hypothetical protein n=1 Tax=Acinetobacter sp. ANC 3781 TaxID=2529835 RepID=UPI00331647D0
MRLLNQQQNIKAQISKFFQITALFWITKVLIITFGETRGDVLSILLILGYLCRELHFSIFTNRIYTSLRLLPVQPWVQGWVIF